MALAFSSSAPSIANTKGPSKIISLSPSATEDLFAIGAGSQILAVSSDSNYPTNAPKSNLDAFSPNIEGIAAMKPDLVILNSGATKASAVRAGLLKLKIPVYFEVAPNNISDVYAEITALGNATGRLDESKKLIFKMKREIANYIKGAKSKLPLTFFHELDNTFYSVTSKTFIGHVYSDFNLKNVADAAIGADSSGYPQLTPEYLLAANPAIIFLADAQYGENLATVSARPGWSMIAAVKNSQILSLPADYPSRWGPRLVDFYKFVAKSISNIK